MTVEAILKNKGSNVFTIRAEHTVGETAKLLSSKKVGVAVVCDAKGRIMGVVSERDIVNGLSQYGKGAMDMPVRNVMSSPVLTCKPADTAREVLHLMNGRRIRHLPVVEGDELVGIVSIGDAVNHRLQQTQLEMGVLRDFAAVR
jgi:CBS domain-containing protein